MALVWLVCFLLALAGPAATRSERLHKPTDRLRPYGSVHALVVGIDRYHLESDLGQLSAARNDAQRMGSLLDERFGASVHSLYDDQATGKSIVDAIRSIAKVDNVDDAVVIFLAGHGIEASSSDGKVHGEFVTFDGGTNADRRPANLTLDELVTLREELHAKHVLLMVDACYSGRLISQAANPRVDATIRGVRRAASYRSFEILTSGAHEEVADRVPGGMHSWFTKTVVEHLDQRTSSQTAQNLWVHVNSRFDADQVPQAPGYTQLGANRSGTFVFVPVPSGVEPEGDKILWTLDRARRRRTLGLVGGVTALIGGAVGAITLGIAENKVQTRMDSEGDADRVAELERQVRTLRPLGGVFVAIGGSGLTLLAGTTVRF